MIHVSFEVNEKVLHISYPLQKKVFLNHVIEKTTTTDNMIIVMLRPDKTFLNNVVGIDFTGNICWEIPYVGTMAFCNIYFDEGELVAGNWSGMHYYLNPETGEIKKSVFLK